MNIISNALFTTHLVFALLIKKQVHDALKNENPTSNMWLNRTGQCLHVNLVKTSKRVLPTGLKGSISTSQKSLISVYLLATYMYSLFGNQNIMKKYPYHTVDSS